MKIALVHYHLKTGGVTTVIKRQIAALGDACDLFVLTGDRADTQLPCEVEEIPGLGYDRSGQPQLPPERVAEQVRRALLRKWSDGCDILHIHNPTLAKNRGFLQVIRRLQDSGIALFLQIHDLAEDGRPQVYFDEPYPEDCHYGVINRRDEAILKAAGLDNSGLHCLPNAVLGMPVDSNRQQTKQVLYPVRAIRRKNLGEALLLSLFFKAGQRLAITQPPNSPEDIASYRDWVAWSSVNGLSVDFEVGRKTPFASIVAASQSMITTSVSEGFGMAYLETWTTGKPLLGRRLPDICSDYEESGIDLQTLYDRIDVPLDWIDRDDFSNRWREAVLRAANRFGLTISDATVSKAFDHLTGRETIDFGMLDEAFQRQILSRLIASPFAKEELIRTNPWLSDAREGVAVPGVIEKNRRVALDRYGMDRYRDRLLQIYDRVVSQPVRHTIDKKILLHSFFRPETFSLLKWAAYGGF
ncbi:hypothetical protein DSCW_10110 [Desulfosarcina widdelii]|uniref:Glycosyltransferase subfamily 4-like N-terminal domain-containing protein n=1 Tax=Desulfosarcina widdelii TaxID=947919 RepID=A0A5K7Z553_9BACT|nr:hypothetical protein [Desulfosarcina widdelii]BBO73594.1 hypothetical protein DSCW_10110 [Desulfosarcina widdelii]